MRVLIVEPKLSYAQLLQGVLKNDGHEVMLCEYAGTAAAMVENFKPTIGLINASLPDQEGLELIASLRRRGERMPVVLMANPHALPRDQEQLHTLRVARVLLKPFSLLGLSEMLETIEREDASDDAFGDDGFDDDDFDDEPLTPRGALGPSSADAATPRTVHTQGLALVADIWREGRSGVLRMPGVSGWALFCAGEPVGAEGLRLTKRCLESGGGDFQEMDISGSGAIHRLADELWSAAIALGPPSPLHLERRLSLCEAAERLNELPLPMALYSLFSAMEGNRRSVLSLCSSLGLDVEAVRRDLGGLVRLGFCSFEETYRSNHADAGGEDASQILSRAVRARKEAEARRKRLTRSTSPRPRRDRPERHRSVRSSDSVSTPSRVASLSRQGGGLRADLPPRVGPRDASTSALRRSEVERLQRELARLRGADDWTILGLSPSSSEAQIHEGIERMQSRYLKLQEDSAQPAVARALARSIGDLIDEAARRVRSGHARLVTAPVEDVFSQAMRLGRAALAEGDFHQAARCFSTARQHDPNAGVVLGLLGWSIYNDDQRSRDPREREGLELLQLADNFGSDDDDLQYYLAFAERRAGLLPRAHKRLRHLLGRRPDYGAARTLLAEVSQALKRD